MKSADTPNDQSQDVAVFAFIDQDMQAEVDFSFLPSGTHFLSSLSEISSIATPRRLVIASRNSETVATVTPHWLEREDSAVEILWNPTLSPDFAYSLIPLSNGAEYSAFRRSNVTAHLVLANAQTDLIISSASRLIPNSTQLLEESATENISIPPEVLKQLIWRYSYVLDQIDPLSNKVQVLQKNLNAAKEMAEGNTASKNLSTELEELTEINKKLVDQIADMEKSLSALQENYDSLSSSRLGSLTLKYWKFRKRYN